MSDAIKAVIERAFACKCGQCEEALQDILRMEEMLCLGAKAEAGRRRKEIHREKRRSYHAKRYREQVREAVFTGGCK